MHVYIYIYIYLSIYSFIHLLIFIILCLYICKYRYRKIDRCIHNDCMYCKTPERCKRRNNWHYESHTLVYATSYFSTPALHKEVVSMITNIGIIGHYICRYKTRRIQRPQSLTLFSNHQGRKSSKPFCPQIQILVSTNPYGYVIIEFKESS